LINYENIINYIGDFIIAGAAFWILAIVTGLGGGDVKLIAAIGLIVGYNSIIFIMCSSYIIGAIVGISLLIMRRKKLVSILPFAPFITISTILCFMVGLK
jgi:leader peptidase (prepilin peptidase)/N-methyltransferase